MVFYYTHSNEYILSITNFKIIDKGKQPVSTVNTTTWAAFSAKAVQSLTVWRLHVPDPAVGKVGASGGPRGGSPSSLSAQHLVVLATLGGPGLVADRL